MCETGRITIDGWQELVLRAKTLAEEVITEELVGGNYFARQRVADLAVKMARMRALYRYWVERDLNAYNVWQVNMGYEPAVAMMFFAEECKHAASWAVDHQDREIFRAVSEAVGQEKVNEVWGVVASLVADLTDLFAPPRRPDATRIGEWAHVLSETHEREWQHIEAVRARIDEVRRQGSFA